MAKIQCPNCGSKIPNGSHVCFKCGTRLKQIQEASNKAIKEAKKNYEYDKIVYSTIFPKDVDYKTTLILTIFLGYFGAHMFYVQRYKWAIYYLVVGLLMFGFAFASGVYNNFDTSTPIGFNNTVADTILRVVCIFGALNLFFWISDIIKVLTKKFKIPVVLKEK